MADEPEREVRRDLHPADSDGELLCRIAARDHEAFEILHRQYVRPIYGLALHCLDDPEQAEDATQLAFAAIWRSAATYVPERGDGARWLFAIARNAILLRKPSLESVDEDSWLAFRVHAAVAELPEQERVPVELAYWSGRSESEIAEQLGLPLRTVKTRTQSALVRLAMRLEGLE